MVKEVAYGDFLNEVKAEVEYFEQGTPWRRKVASLSVLLLHENDISSVDYFLDKNVVIELVRDQFPKLCDELIRDIGEFLSQIAKDMLFKANLPAEINDYVEMQRKKREGKPLRFKDKLNGS